MCTVLSVCNIVCDNWGGLGEPGELTKYTRQRDRKHTKMEVTEH